MDSRLQSLPNLIYSDGNSFSLWRNGELVGEVIHLEGDVENSGAKLTGPLKLVGLIEDFLRWSPSQPRSAKELATTSARLCRLLRDEVVEQLALGSESLNALAKDWRKLLFPEATDEKFADGYAQAVTFGMLMARAKGVKLADGLQDVARELSKTSSLIGEAMKLLTDKVESQQTLKTSIGTLTRVLDVVDWKKIAKGNPEVWLYFYEDFLDVYDRNLRKQTGSYYTPPEVVAAMVNLVDEALRSERFGLGSGLASPAVTLADPATGTGTYLLGILRKIAETVKQDEGEGAVRGAINAAINRLIAFELQLGPFAVAQLRLLAEVLELTGGLPRSPLRMFVTNTLGNPDDDEGWIPSFAATIAQSRKEANKIKRDEPITVVIGNPPYKEKAKGRGGWVEGQTKKEEATAPMAAWKPPREWGVGTHAKHLKNLYVYFWRWATWKVFDHHPGNTHGVVCFITVAGFLNGPGFQRMREYLRQKCDDIWVIDCSPEGHQPEVNTRVFQDVQQPICIVLASRSSKSNPEKPARVLFRELPAGHRDDKFKALTAVRLAGAGWQECPTDWRAAFLPTVASEWGSYPALETLFAYNGSGVMPGRTWPIAPDQDSLNRRWQKLIREKNAEEKERLFHPHMPKGMLGDRHVQKKLGSGLPSFPSNTKSVGEESGKAETPIPYGFRSFDRQWIIPDNRLINRPNPTLWACRSDRQVFLTALSRSAPSSGPALTLTGSVPDLDHYKGSFGGRVMPLWSNAKGTQHNFRPKLLTALEKLLKKGVSAEDLFAYVVGVASHPAYTNRFQDELTQPGLRIPITREPKLFAECAELGRRVVWLHTFGERFHDAKAGRPKGPPRLGKESRPLISKEGSIPEDSAGMPDTLRYDAAARRLYVGAGFIDNVAPAAWQYEVSGKQVLTQWFSYRKKNRERPIIGDRRPPSPLGDIQPDHWLPEYTTELLNVINVLTILAELEPQQSKLLEKICSGDTITAGELERSGAFELPPKKPKVRSVSQTTDAFSEDE